MPHAISIKCLNETAAPIFRLWQQAGRFENIPSMRELAYPPHVTLAVFPNLVGGLETVLDDVFASHSKLLLTFESISYFENDVIVLWAKPRPCSTLLALHAQLHRHIDPTACHEHYRKERWVPHCSLATRVPKSQATAAISWAKQKREEFSVEFDAADLVVFPPVAIAKECLLL
ncbi:2'-5' RNA ligase [Rhizobium sp. BK077]|uniref:2'-5' RNA ligase family protein n=1 Tax=Rhizobium TaxID=379 RepID=UPI000BE8E2D9|nr:MULTISPECIES: 2'-5' RNA ligase family protein [Rhizobium]MBB3298094.1 2'-5' RNA ligase [Rhizobium sp. BK112]MBB3366601.1 2'-5' RNA ligase [Rhizobium sp. BK077]MBB4177412.1 2'-5' RNA ligase [Rhizobium sp. BK109]PDS39153.1 calmodulin [Rhizobium anhuiense]